MVKKQTAPQPPNELDATLRTLGERGLLGRLEELTVGGVSIKLGAERPATKPAREMTQEDIDRIQYASSGLTS